MGRGLSEYEEESILLVVLAICSFSDCVSVRGGEECGRDEADVEDECRFCSFVVILLILALILVVVD
jgi:hypothetical protein